MTLINLEDPFEPTPEELNIAKEIMQKENGRSLDDEREFMENLLVQRLNFLLIVFSIFIAAGFAVKSYFLSAIIFFVGAFISYSMAKIVYRAHVKHHWIMRLFYNQKTSDSELPHVIKFINDAMKEPKREKLTKGSVSNLVGKKIPTICWVSLLIFGILFSIIAIY